MPVRRLYRTRMVLRLTALLARMRHTNPGISFAEFIIAAYMEINPTFSKYLHKNFSFLEGVAAYLGRFLLLDDGRPDRNILYYFVRLIKSWNDRPRNIRRQIQKNPYDFQYTSRPTRRDPLGVVSVVTHRLIEPERGNNAVDLTQRDLDNTSAGILAKRERLEECRDKQAVDISITELLRELGV